MVDWIPASGRTLSSSIVSVAWEQCQPRPSRARIVRHAHTDLTLGRVAHIADNDVKARLVCKGL